jgi:hypothetical protein
LPRSLPNTSSWYMHADRIHCQTIHLYSFLPGGVIETVSGDQLLQLFNEIPVIWHRDVLNFRQISAEIVKPVGTALPLAPGSRFLPLSAAASVVVSYFPSITTGSSIGRQRRNLPLALTSRLRRLRPLACVSGEPFHGPKSLAEA